MPRSIRQGCRYASCCRKAKLPTDHCTGPDRAALVVISSPIAAMTRARIDLVARRGGRAHIPTYPDRKVQRSVDRALYRQRNFIERFFNELKHFRRIATRYNKTARNFWPPSCLPPPACGFRFESTTYAALRHFERKFRVRIRVRKGWRSNIFRALVAVKSVRERALL